MQQLRDRQVEDVHEFNGVIFSLLEDINDLREDNKELEQAVVGLEQDYKQRLDELNATIQSSNAQAVQDLQDQMDVLILEKEE